MQFGKGKDIKEEVQTLCIQNEGEKLQLNSDYKKEDLVFFLKSNRN